MRATNLKRLVAEVGLWLAVLVFLFLCFAWSWEWMVGGLLVVAAGAVAVAAALDDGTGFWRGFVKWLDDMLDDDDGDD